ncbi:SDR family oxidoreductase [Spirillospora sp. NPDC029432]|uniref:SDR family oxidoreductase n=1 Tax=Spirillospora sp. NPDC029432 TaxID=3154599 RepID=UPI0034541780
MRPTDTTALVAGGTRGAGRGIATELGATGATVYVTGRTTRESRSDLDRPETIEDTAELVTKAGGTGIPVRCDHSEPEQVRALIERIGADHGRLDLLVNDVWGGDALTEWDSRLWEHDLGNGLKLLHRAVDTHIITSHFALPLMIRRGRGLVVEITDGTERFVDEMLDGYRGAFFYDLAKQSVIRLARNQAAELRPHGVAALALTPGFLRSEAMLELFGITEANWRDGAAKDPHFAQSETPAYIGRAVAALAADPDIMAKSGGSYDTGELAKEYGFTDVNGTQPDFAAYYRDFLAASKGDAEDS